MRSFSPLTSPDVGTQCADKRHLHAQAQASVQQLAHTLES